MDTLRVDTHAIDVTRSCRLRSNSDEKNASKRNEIKREKGEKNDDIKMESRE